MLLTSCVNVRIVCALGLCKVVLAIDYESAAEGEVLQRTPLSTSFDKGLCDGEVSFVSQFHRHCVHLLHFERLC